MFRLLFITIFIIPITIHAQQSASISYKQAIALLLKNNFDIQIAKNNATIADVQNNYGSAGFLPKLDFNAGTALANNKTKQEMSCTIS